MVKKKHEAIVLMEKLHSAETKNQQGRSSEGQTWRGGGIVAGEHWEAHGKPEGEQGKRRENL